MKDLKIRVADESESKEAQELLDALGYSKGAFKNKSTPCWIAICNGLTYSDYNIGKSIWYTAYPKEITLQELRDMVNPMKEYLEKQADGSYKLVMRGIVGKDDDIEVPEGAEIAVKFKNDIDEHGAVFYKNNGKSAFSEKTKFWEHDSNWTMRELLDENHFYGDIDLSHRILWQRHVQPEELPFIDDGIIDCREAIQEIYKPTDFGASSLNDQYAEIEQVRKQTIEATLAERQAQYGCFEDVARTTGKIMEALAEVRVGGLDELPYPHRMALYMIASKMARIVNGDFNHKDGWHDIGGYSKLVEDLL